MAENGMGSQRIPMQQEDSKHITDFLFYFLKK